MENNSEQTFFVKLKTEENKTKLEENNKINENNNLSLSSSFVCQQCNSEINTFVEFIGFN
jgi:hypothetical protein